MYMLHVIFILYTYANYSYIYTYTVAPRGHEPGEAQALSRAT